MPHDPLALGDRIRELRERKGWTQPQLEKASGVSRPTISLIERGNTQQPTLVTIGRLARALDADEAELAELAGLNSQPVSPSVKLQRMVERMTPQSIQLFYAIGSDILLHQDESPETGSQ